MERKVVKLKRCLSISILVLTSVILMAACSKDIETSNFGNDATPKEDTSSGISLTPPGTFPIVEEPVELTVLVSAEPRMDSWETNTFTQYYEELTNVRIHFEVAPEDGADQALNLRLASGDVPDMIMAMPISQVQEMIYGSQGVFLPLNDLIEEHGHFIHDMFDAHPEYYETMTTPDGNIYSLPLISECYHCSMSNKMWIYKPWLEQLNLDMPETTEEFYEVLKKFKEQDPNNNGANDEIPLAGAPSDVVWNADIETFIMNSFVYTPGEKVYLDNGQVKVSFNQPGWKEGLKYLNRLYEEGLLADESFTQDAQQFRQMGENPDIPILGAFAGGHMGAATELGGSSGRWLDYTAVPPLEGPSGLRQAVNRPLNLALGRFVITHNTEHAEVAMRWADGLFNEDIMHRAFKGIEGEEWIEAPDGRVGIDGREHPKWEQIKPHGSHSNNHWFERAPAYMSEDYRLSWSAGEHPDEELEFILYKETEKMEPYRAPLEMVLPPLYYTEDQASELADLQITIMNYVDQMIARFVTGSADIEKEWDNYLNTLDDMNLERFIEIQQEAYDASGS